MTIMRRGREDVMRGIAGLGESSVVWSAGLGSGVAALALILIVVGCTVAPV